MLSQKVNAITKEQSWKIKTNVEEVKALMKVIYECLVKVEFLDLGKMEQDKKEMLGYSCEYHTTVMGHTIQCCKEFWGVVQTMMDQGRIEFYEEKEGENERYHSTIRHCPQDHDMNN